MKYVKLAMFLGCIGQSVFGMDPQYLTVKGDKVSYLKLSLDNTFKSDLQLQIAFFNKNGKQVGDSIKTLKVPGSIQIPTEATQCTLSTIIRHVPHGGSEVVETMQRIFFNKGKMISLNFDNPSYILSSANDVYSATPVKSSASRKIKPGKSTSPTQIIHELEHKLLARIDYLATPRHCGPMKERRFPRPGTQEYTQYQQEELRKEAEAQKLHISTLKQIIKYVENQIKASLECDAL